MEEQQWIDIVQFAKKYGVSQSTLRRRIRAKALAYRMVKGKYYIPDAQESMETAPLYSRIRPKQAVVSGSHFNTGSSLLSNAEYDQLKEENRKLKAKISELETLVKVLEAQSI